MRKILTISDLDRYSHEAALAQIYQDGHMKSKSSPDPMVLHHLVSYSKALQVCKTLLAGDAFLLLN
jgi:hypothetical protein